MRISPNLPRRIASRVLRGWLANASGHYGGLERLDQEFPGRRDVRRFVVQEGLVIDVFWKSLGTGKGPALSLFVCGDEFARFDCFGPDNGHYHLALFTPAATARQRIRLPEGTASEQIGRTIFEIASNLAYYLERAANPAIRKFSPRSDLLLAVLPTVEAAMRGFLREVPELRDQR